MCGTNFLAGGLRCWKFQHGNSRNSGFLSGASGNDLDKLQTISRCVIAYEMGQVNLNPFPNNKFKPLKIERVCRRQMSVNFMNMVESSPKK